ATGSRLWSRSRSEISVAARPHPLCLEPSMSLSAPKQYAIDGAPFSVGIVAARFNPDLVDALLHRVRTGLAAAGVKAERITLARVPGSHELPVAAQWLAR